MADTFTLDTVHNFGVYTKSGKRTIFQIDFSCKCINLIERGNIKKRYTFEQITQYDSEDDLHLILRFQSLKNVEFDADTAEEKYTICHLLGIILGNEQFDDIRPEQNGPASRHPDDEPSYIRPKKDIKKQVIKEGILEKKGNTKLPTWSKRNLQVCPGELSYFKPGEDIALNIVQLCENSTSILPNGNNGLTVAVRDRNYQFRVIPGKGKPNVEQERDIWIEALTQAAQRKRATLLLLEIQKSRSYLYPNDDQTRPLPDSSLLDEERFYYNMEPPRPVGGSSSSGDLNQPILSEELDAINKLDQAITDSSYTEKRPGNTNTQSGQPNEIMPDYSHQLSPSIGTNTRTVVLKQTDIGELPVDANSPSPFKDQSSGKFTRYIGVSPSNSTEKVAQLDSSEPAPTPAPVNKPAGAVSVMIKINEIHKLKSIGSIGKKYLPKENIDIKAQSENKENSKEKASPLPTSAGSHVPSRPLSQISLPPSSPIPPPTMSPIPQPPMSPIPPPPPMSPNPPPLMPNQPLSGRRLKHVFWSIIPRTLIHNSIWERPHDMTRLLNVPLLVDQFAAKERDIPAQGMKPGGNKPQLLIEAKRAQNLGIFMSGLKHGGIRKLVDVLNSVKEDDEFPSEKLTTIRRYQPTQDEKDMYKDYVTKKHELHPVDQFMLELCQIPCLSIRIDICLIIWDFPWQFAGTCQLIEQVHGACDELLNSEMLVLVLEYLLAIGNYMNTYCSEGNATNGFQISSIEKFLDVRGKDHGYTLVHFLVEQLKTSDPDLLRWTETVQTVYKCEHVSVKAVAAESEVLKGDLTKAKKHLQILKSKMANVTRRDQQFQYEAQNLTNEYEMNLAKSNRRCGELHNKYRRLLIRFGEPCNQRSDNLFAVVTLFADRFKAALKDIDNRALERKSSTS